MKRKRVIAGILVLTIIIASCSTGCAKEVSFEKAMKKPELRDNYIAKIVQKIGKPEYVIIVNYDNTPEELEFLKEEYGYTHLPADHLMAAHSPKMRADLLGKQSFPVRVSVFPFAFSGEIIKTETDFISSFLHEYFHAESIQTGRVGSLEIASSFLTTDGQWNKDLFLDIDEMVTIKKELATKTKISEDYRLNRLGRYLHHYSSIWDHSEKMQPEFIKKLKVDFFEPWIIDTPYLFKEWLNGKESWHLKHPKTGKKYFLPDEIIRRFQNGKG